jgi:hypothetical protein
VHADPFAVAGDDAAGLLAPVLEGVEAEEGEAGRVRVPLDAEDATVFRGFIVLPDGRVFGFRFSVGFIGQSGQSMQWLYLVLIFYRLSYFGSEV